MGCRLTKNDINTPTKMDNDELPSQLRPTDALSVDPINNARIDYKSRLERKMCLAKETPEPNYDLSDCNLKDVPSGVFILCRVLRKEILDLSRNRLITINNGGLYSDLHLIRVLNLRYNRIKQLPDEICKLENLRELFISNNLLVKLPKTINTLKYLELLDISCNNIDKIDEIKFMPQLKILNVSGNRNLHRLPVTLGTCDNLYDLIFDIDNIEWPTKDILLSGTYNITKYLTTGEISEIKNQVFDNNDNSKMKQSDIADINVDDIDIGEEITETNEVKYLNEEKQKQKNYVYDTIASDQRESALIRELQERRQKHKQELLQELLCQQHETEYLVNKIQQQKDNEKSKLIQDVLQAEETSNFVIENLLKLKISTDYNLLEKEQIEQERVLEKLYLEHSELRKQEILSTMLEQLRDEECKIQNYQNTRVISSQDILEKEIETTTQLQHVLQQCEKNRNEIIQKICENEEIQKQAVINLISKNDARTWGLVEQLRIVEAQLVKMTKLEIQKKKISSVEQMNELSNKRLCLTLILTDLLEQQEDRRRELLNTILSMEAQKCNEQDFWLLQYQRLIDSRPLEFSVKTNSIDPLLGYNFLVNGVIHCLPFLQKLWQNEDINLETLTIDHLKAVGIKSERDQKLILKSIQQFLHDNESTQDALKLITTVTTTSSSGTMSPSAPPLSPVDNCNYNESEGATAYSGVIANQNLPECVICMEEWVKIIFIPCGHMCCCLNCQIKVEICPMCRSNIERKVKIVQP